MGDPVTRTLFMLTFVTGIVDAVAFLGLGQVFAAMQTGNVAFLGFGIAGAADAPVVAPLIALGSFVAGGGVGAGLTAAGVPRRTGGLIVAMGIEVLLLGSAAVIAATVDVSPDHVSAYVLISTLSFAMGLRNTMTRPIGGPNLATTVLNLTMTAVAPHAPAGVASGRDLALRASAIAAILAGAICGALLLKTSLALPIAAAAAITLTALVSHTLARRGAALA